MRKNLSIVNEWLKEDPSRIKDHAGYQMSLDEQVEEVFCRSGANLFCGFTFSRLSLVQMKKHVEVDGISHLESALVGGRGVIILLAHMGPWEALAHLPALARDLNIDAPFGAMYRPLNNSYLDDWYRSQRESQGTRMFSRRDGFNRPVDFLRSGGMLGILADQKMREGVSVDYFNRSAKTTPIPTLFSRRAGGTPVLALSLVSEGTLKWKLRILPKADIATSSKVSREEGATICNQVLQEAISDGHLDVFWFQRRFA